MKITFKPSDIPLHDSRTIGTETGTGARVVGTRRSGSVSIFLKRNLRGERDPVEFDGVVKFEDPSKPITIETKELRRSWDEPKGPDEWDGPSPTDVFDALNEDPERIHKFKDQWSRDRFAIDGVSVELETRCLNDRRFEQGTRYGLPRRFRIEEVRLQAGGYSANDQKRRGMKNLFKREEWESELLFKFEELRDYAFDMDQAKDARRRASKAREAKLKARRQAFKEADGDAKRETFFGADVPETLTLDLSKIDPRDLPDLLDLIDVTVRELVAANEWNEKVSESD